MIGPATGEPPRLTLPGSGDWVLEGPLSVLSADAVKEVVESGLGLAMRGCSGGQELARLDGRLAVAEAEAGREEGTTAVLAVLDAPAALLALGSFVGAPRLAGLVLDGSALAALFGGLPETARLLIAAAAAAAGVPVFEMGEQPEEA